jgi:CBS domain-containing protein
MLTVRDLMQTEVVTISPEATVRELTRLLADTGISGVPVVGPAGTVLGVVSSSDVVRLAAEERETGLVRREGRWSPRLASAESDPEDEDADPLSDYFLPEDSPLIAADWGGAGQEGPMDELSVSDIMTPVTFTLPVTTSARDLADFLVRGRIHRAVVVEDGRLQGIVTTMDILRALANERI